MQLAKDMVENNFLVARSQAPAWEWDFFGVLPESSICTTDLLPSMAWISASMPK